MRRNWGWAWENTELKLFSLRLMPWVQFRGKIGRQRYWITKRWIMNLFARCEMRRENRSFWKVLDQWTHKKEADPPALAFMLFVLVQYTRLYLKIPSHEIHSTQNPFAQNPFFLKIPSKKIPSFSKSRRKKSSRSQNPVGKNPVILKIPSKKIPSISKSRRSKSIH